MLRRFFHDGRRLFTPLFSPDARLMLIISPSFDYADAFRFHDARFSPPLPWLILLPPALAMPMLH